MPDLSFASPLWDQLSTIKNDTEFEAYSISKGQKEKVTSASIVIRPGQQEVELKGTSTKLSYDQIAVSAMWIDTFAYAKSSYCKFPEKTRLFRVLYPVNNTNVLYYHDAVKSEPCMMCVNCGVVLARRYLQMDHQRPQKDGEIEAVIKVMRVLGFATAAPKGPKCTELHTAIGAFANNNRTTVGGDLMKLFMSPTKYGVANAVVPKANRAASSDTQAAKDQRYTLGPLGCIFYSLVEALSSLDNSDDTLMDGLESQCMNSLANIRPLCSYCNGKRGNRDLKYP